MPSVIECKCGKRYRIKDEQAGKKMKCRACESILTIPGPAPAQANSDEDDRRSSIFANPNVKRVLLLWTVLPLGVLAFLICVSYFVHHSRERDREYRRDIQQAYQTLQSGGGTLFSEAAGGAVVTCKMRSGEFRALTLSEAEPLARAAKEAEINLFFYPDYVGLASGYIWFLGFIIGGPICIVLSAVGITLIWRGKQKV